MGDTSNLQRLPHVEARQRKGDQGLSRKAEWQEKSMAFCVGNGGKP